MTNLRELRRVYGFDEVAIVPGAVTVNPEMVNTEFSVGNVTTDIPVLGSAMDAVASPEFAGEMHRQGAMSVMNLEGVQTRYEDPQESIEEIAAASREDVTTVMQRVYSQPIKEKLVGLRVEEIKKTGAHCAVSVTPAFTKKYGPLAVEAGADMLVVQSTVTTARHSSASVKGLQFPELLEMVDVPVLVGNCVGYDVATEIMDTGIHGILVGVGPGAAGHAHALTPQSQHGWGGAPPAPTDGSIVPF